jgi:flagellar biosynthesis protein FlhG
MIKSLVLQVPDVVIQLVVNMAASETESRSVFNRINRVTQTFLHRPLQYGGMVPMDPAVPAAVRQRLPFTLLAPDAPATIALDRLADRLCGGEEQLVAEDAAVSAPSRGFFSRLATWLGMADQAEVD